MADLNEQLRLQTELNKVIAQRQALIDKQSASLRQQAQISKEICKALECGSLEDGIKKSRDFGSSLDQAAEKAEKASQKNQGFADSIKQSGENAKGATSRFKRLFKAISNNAVKIGFTLGLMKGFGNAFKSITNLGKGLVRGFMAITRGAFNLGKAIIKIPFQIMGNLMQMAQQGGISPFRQALEKLRGEMGDLASGPARDVVNSVYNIRKTFNDSSQSAVGFGRIFGYGQEGLAKALEFSMEAAKGIGPVFHTMTEEFKENAGKLAMFQKGLGLTSEQMGDVVARAKAAGEDYNKVFAEMEHYSHHLGKAFNISSKAISRDVGEMRMDIERFGFASVKSLTETAVQTKRLGITMKTLQGVIDKFDNFEDAARSAARLRRQFGIMIDARKMVGMSGIERLEYIKKQFAASGKDITKMGRIEMKYLKEATGMDAAQLAALTGKANKNKSLNDVKKAGAKAQAKEISQAKSMLRLSKAIEKQLQSGNTSYRSFFGAFLGGFQKGVMRAGPFRKMLRNLAKSIRVVEMSGRRVGRMFVRMFPGMKDMVEGLQKLFNPGRFRPFMGEIESHFKTLFTALSASPTEVSAAMENFFSGITESYKKFFKSGGPGAKQFASGFDTFVTVIGNVGLKLVAKTSEIAANMINALADGLQKINTSKIMSGGETAAEIAGEGLSSRFGAGFSNLFTVLKDKLFPALGRIFSEMIPFVMRGLFNLMDKVKQYFKDNSKELGKKIGEALKSTFFVLIELFKNMPWEAQALIIAKIFGGALLAALIASLPGLLASGFSMIAPAIGAALTGPIGIGVAMALAGAAMETKIKEHTGKLEKEYGTQIGRVAGGLTALVDTVTFGLIPESAMTSIGTFLGDSLGSIKNVMDSLGLGVLFDGAADAASGFFKTVEGLGEVLKGIFTLDFEKVVSGFKNIGRGVTRYFIGSIKFAIGKILAIPGVLWAAVKQIPNVISAIPDMIFGVIKSAGAFIYGFFDELGIFPKETLDQVAGFFSSAFDTIYSIVSGVFDGIALIFEGLIKVVSWVGSGIWSGLSWVFEKLWGAVKWVGGLIGDMIGGLFGFFKKIGSAIWSVFEAPINWISEKVKYWLNKLPGWAKKRLGIGSELEEAASEAAEPVAKNATKAIKDEVPNMVGAYSGGLDQMQSLASGADLGMSIEVTPEFKGNMTTDARTLMSLDPSDKLAVKVEKLEDMKKVVDNLKKLQGLPKELETMKKKFDKIDPDKIGASIINLFGKIDEIMYYITNEITTRGYSTAGVTFDTSIIETFEGIKKLRESLDKVLGKGTLSQKTINLRKENISNAIDAVSELTYKVSGATIYGEMNPFIEATMALQGTLEGIHGEGGLLSSVPKSIARKVKTAKKSIDEVGNMIAKINKSKNLKIAVALGDKMSQNGKVAITIDKTQINLNLKVDINARKFAQKLIQADLKPSQKGKQRLATTDDIKAAK
jgi:phage-related protein